jgi:hypothetical protein
MGKGDWLAWFFVYGKGKLAFFRCFFLGGGNMQELEFWYIRKKLKSCFDLDDETLMSFYVIDELYPSKL